MDSFQISAFPNPGYSFSHWTGDFISGSANPGTFDPNDCVQANVTAVFEPTASLTVSVSPEEGGSVSSSDLAISCPRRCSWSYANPVSITLEATPAPCYELSHWTVNGLDSTEHPLPLLMDTAKDVTAHFVQAQTLVLSDATASPDKVPADARTTTTLTVQVTHEDEPPSVTVDLSSLGRSASQPMYDDGTNGDATAGDGIYTVQTSARASTPISMKALQVIASDSCGNVAGAIKLFVTSLITDTVQPQGMNTHTVNNSIAGQTFNINHQLVPPSGYQIMQNGQITISVKNPSGQVVATETMSTDENTITVSDSAAGDWTYEVANNITSSSLSGRALQQNPQGAYQIETVTGGLGIVTGTVTDAAAGTNLTGIRMSTDTGGASITVGGNYVMVGVAGVFTVSASSLGYEPQSVANVTVTSGGSVTVDLALTPVTIPFNVAGVRTNLSGPPRVGSNVQVTILLTSSGSSPQYRWLANTVPFTAWETLANWTIFNDSEPWSPASDNLFVVLAHAAEAGETTDFHQGGLLFETEGNSSNPIQILEFTADLDYPQQTGTPITLSATAGGGSGTIYFKFFYRPQLGGWSAVGDWNQNGQATWTPQQPGFYTIVVHISENNTAIDNASKQAGMTFVIE